MSATCSALGEDYIFCWLLCMQEKWDMHLCGCQTIYHFNKAEVVLGPWVAFLFTAPPSPVVKFSLRKWLQDTMKNHSAVTNTFFSLILISHIQLLCNFSFHSVLYKGNISVFQLYIYKNKRNPKKYVEAKNGFLWSWHEVRRWAAFFSYQQDSGGDNSVSV